MKVFFRRTKIQKCLTVVQLLSYTMGMITVVRCLATKIELTRVLHLICL